MDLKSNKLPRFVAAMQQVYAFPTEAMNNSWTPPPASAGHLGRYLWTDAFGVLNFLTLHRASAHPLFLNHAKSLVTAVHSTLGRTRDLLSYLPEASASNPLAGGLRIGKDDATGPDGDGSLSTLRYHHYLTLWMFALNRLSIISGEKEYNDQAIALAKAIHSRFVYNRNNSSRPRMYWKMSIDLKEPLVKSEGNLDPVDGLVVFRLLQKTDGKDSSVLAKEIEDYQRIVDTKWKNYSSSDPLDLGMTLWTAHWEDEGWAQGLVDSAEQDIEDFWETAHFRRPTSRRLAFRDFGLALDSILQAREASGLVPEPKAHHTAGLNAAEDLQPINLVMYAAALIPGAAARRVRIYGHQKTSKPEPRSSKNRRLLRGQSEVICSRCNKRKQSAR